MRETLSNRERCIWIVSTILLVVAACLNYGSTGSREYEMTMTMKRYLEEEDEVQSEEEPEQQPEEEEEEEEEEELNPIVLASVVASIVLFLILMTILFELFKEHIEEHADRRVRPIIEKLFGEMTILGFLALMTFVITKMGFFEALSVRIFHEADELLEIFESIHFTLFFVMIFFVVQVLILVKNAMIIQQQWNHMERKIAASEQTTNSIHIIPHNGAHPSTTATATLSSSASSHHSNETNEFQIYKALRTEFLLDRSFEPPFEPSSNQLEQTFKFDLYLGNCLGSVLSHVVQVHPPTWIFFAVVTILYFAFSLFVHEDDNIMVWSWIAFGWLVLILNLIIEHQLSHILIQLTPLKPKREHDNSGTPSNESTGLLQSEDLPGWCYADLSKPRSLLERLIVKSKPNRQQSLYWMGRQGPKYYRWLLQLNLLFLGIYCSFHILHFYTKIKENESTTVFILYLVLSILPVVGILVIKERLVGSFALVSSLGCYKRPQIVQKVLLEEKTERVVHMFFVLYKLNLCIQNMEHGTEQDYANGTRKLQYWEYQRVKKSFESLDQNDNGELSPSELAVLLELLGAQTSEEMVDKIVATLDKGKNGHINEDEFIAWYAANSNDEHMSQHTRSEFFFHLFDSDGSGELTIEEFKRKLDKLNMGLTLDEIGDVVNELDEDNSGTISAHEFSHLLHKYAPSSSSSSHHGGGGGHHH